MARPPDVREATEQKISKCYSYNTATQNIELPPSNALATQFHPIFSSKLQEHTSAAGKRLTHGISINLLSHLANILIFHTPDS